MHSHLKRKSLPKEPKSEVLARSKQYFDCAFQFYEMVMHGWISLSYTYVELTYKYPSDYSYCPRHAAVGRTTGHSCIVGHLCMTPKRPATFSCHVTSPSACCQHPSNCTFVKRNFLDADQTMPRACRCGIACGSALGIVVRTYPSACIACALHPGARGFPPYVNRVYIYGATEPIHHACLDVLIMC